jgi:uncharacterized membrane protein
MERKHQFLLFSAVLLAIGFLQYFRKIANGLKMNKVQKILYLATMVIFTIGTMVVLYFTNLDGILPFCLGLVIVILSEPIAKLFLILGDNFNKIVIKLLSLFIRVDFTDELLEKEKEKEIMEKKKLEEENSPSVNNKIKDEK